ncbi:hypothetical protein T440DRAFT_400824, partial [Plenodomus tracheiphilus IPT5]
RHATEHHHKLLGWLVKLTPPSRRKHDHTGFGSFPKVLIAALKEDWGDGGDAQDPANSTTINSAFQAMSSRNRHSSTRHSASRPSVAPSPGRNASDNLPAYKKPSHPLDAEATRALRELQGRNLDSVKKHAKQATATITKTAASVNDMLREHGQYIERRQKKWDAGRGLDDKDHEERTMAELQQKVEEATTKLEESMRAVIDSGIAAQRIDSTLDWLRLNAPKHLDDEYQTQMTQRATQRQYQIASQTHTQGSDGDEDMDNTSASATTNNPTPGPTPLDSPRVALTGPSELYITRMQREKDAYTSLTLTTRYARNNDYRDFRRVLHDAKYGDTGPTLGHEDTWFTDTGSPAPGITDPSQRGAYDSDDDIIVDKATISTRCPLTYQTLKDPYTSTKCPHTFEKKAILEMIRGSAVRVTLSSGRGTAKVVECPIQGCSQMLTQDDFRTDIVLVRRIQRLIAVEEEGRKAGEEDEEDEEGEEGGEGGDTDVGNSK